MGGGASKQAQDAAVAAAASASGGFAAVAPGTPSGPAAPATSSADAGAVAPLDEGKRAEGAPPPYDEPPSDRSGGGHDGDEGLVDGSSGGIAVAVGSDPLDDVMDLSAREREEVNRTVSEVAAQDILDEAGSGRPGGSGDGRGDEKVSEDNAGTVYDGHTNSHNANGNDHGNDKGFDNGNDNSYGNDHGTGTSNGNDSPPNEVNEVADDLLHEFVMDDDAERRVVTLLFEVAAFYDKDEQSRLLLTELSKDLPVDARDEHQNTLLLVACQHRSVALVEQTLGRGADANMQNDKMVCPLHIACHKSTVSYVEERGWAVRVVVCCEVWCDAVCSIWLCAQWQ